MKRDWDYVTLARTWIARLEICRLAIDGPTVKGRVRIEEAIASVRNKEQADLLGPCSMLYTSHARPV